MHSYTGYRRRQPLGRTHVQPRRPLSQTLDVSAYDRISMHDYRFACSRLRGGSHSPVMAIQRRRGGLTTVVSTTHRPAFPGARPRPAGWSSVRDRVQTLRATVATRRSGSRTNRSGRNPDLAQPPHGRALGSPIGTVLDADLTRFIYELLDAHDDTARLALERARDDEWDAHLDYLRALQRAGRALLARSSVSPGSTPGLDA